MAGLGTDRTRTTFLVGLTGSVLLAASATVVGRSLHGDWVNHLPLVALARHHARGPAYLVAFLGLALLVGAWLALRSQVRAPSHATWVAAGWVTPLLLVPPLFSDDGWSYVAVGRLARLGLSPYLYPPAALAATPGVSHRWLHTTSPYGPLAVAWGAGWAHLSASPWVVLLGFRLLALLGLALLAWTVPRLARWVGRDPADAAWLVVANPLLLVHGVAGVHLDLVMVALVLLALDLARGHGWVGAAVVAGLAAAVKWPALLVVPGVVLVGLPASPLWARLRRLAAVTAVSLTTLLLSGLLPATGTGWVHGVTSVRSWFSLSDDAGVLLGDRPLLHVLAGCGLVVLVGLLVLRGAATRAEALRGAAWVAVAVLLAAPVVQFWYVLWCVPLLAVAPLPRHWARALVVGSAALAVVAPYDVSRHLPGSPGLPLAVVALAILAAVLSAALPSGSSGRQVADSPADAR